MEELRRTSVLMDERCVELPPSPSGVSAVEVGSRRPYIKPLSWVINMDPLSLLAGTSTSPNSPGGFGEPGPDEPDPWE